MTKSWEFERVYRQGKRLRGEFFQVILCPCQGDSGRIGISVHRGVRGAVRRNRIKRIIRECLRTNTTLLPPGFDTVITVRPGFSLRGPAEVERALRSLLARGGAGSAGKSRACPGHE